MITVLLEKIITILEGWIQSFSSHAQHVEDKLDSLDQTASDIETNTEPISDIADNTGAVITPIQNIKSNTDSIKQSSQTSTNNTTAILNNISTLSTNTGRAAAFAQDCANNTLEIKDKVTTIASDTTQLRADSANIAADVSSINQAIGYYVANTLVTEDSEGSIANFDTDLQDYLQKAVVTIPANVVGISGIVISKNGKNLCNVNDLGHSGVYNDTGKVRPSNDRLYTDYIKIDNTKKVSTTIIGEASSEPIHINRYIEYDENKQFLRRVLAGVASTHYTYSPSSDCVYVIIDLRTENLVNISISDIEEIQVEISDSSTEYEPYSIITNSVTFGSSITDGASVDLLSGIVTINTSPVTYDSITPLAIRTFKGINNVYSDIGDISVTYRETLKHYLDKHNQ